MANTKLMLDGESFTAWFGLENYAVNPAKPTVAELNATLPITCAASTSDWSFGNQASNQVSDPAMCDVGNVQTRGYANFGGTISFFYPGTYEASNEYYQVFQAFRNQGTVGYLIIRVDGKKTTAGAPDADKEAVANDLVHIYKVMSDGWTNPATGEASPKYTINFLAQGSVWVHRPVATAVTVATPAKVRAADTFAVGDKVPLTSSMNTRVLHTTVNQWSGTPGWFSWESSDLSVATVDQNGVAHLLSAGSADITATDLPSGITSTALAITVT